MANKSCFTSVKRKAVGHNSNKVYDNSCPNEEENREIPHHTPTVI